VGLPNDAQLVIEQDQRWGLCGYSRANICSPNISFETFTTHFICWPDKGHLGGFSALDFYK